MVEFLESINVVEIIKVIVLFPIFVWIKSFFNFDEQDKVMLSRPDKRFQEIVVFTQLVFVFGVMNLVYYFTFEKNSSSDILLQNTYMRYISAKLFNISVCIMIFLFSLLYYFYGKSKSKIWNGVKVVIISILYFCFSAIVFLGNTLESFKYNVIVFISFIIAISFYLLKYVIKPKLDLKGLVGKAKLFEASIVCALYSMTYIWTIDKVPVNSKIMFIIVNMVFLISIVANGRSLNKYAQYFNCTYELSKLYNIENVSKKNFNTFKLYIYYTTNDRFYVCGKDKEIALDTVRYLISYEDVNKSGGFFSEKINEV